MLFRSESRSAGDTGSRGHGGKERANESVDVEQRHHAETPVGRAEGEGPGDVTRRGAKVLMAQGDELWSGGRSRGVEQKCHVLRRRLGEIGSPGQHGTFHLDQVEFTCRSAGGNVEFEDWQASPPGGKTGGLAVPGGYNNRRGGKVGEVKLQFLGAVRGVERGEGQGSTERQKGGGHLRAIRQDQGESISGAQAQVDQTVSQTAALAIQCRKRTRGAFGRDQRQAGWKLLRAPTE